jgi:hypothetical protein
VAGPLRYSSEPGGSELAALRHAKPLVPAQPALLGAIKGEIQNPTVNRASGQQAGCDADWCMVLTLTLLNHQPLSMVIAIDAAE